MKFSEILRFSKKFLCICENCKRSAELAEVQAALTICGKIILIQTRYA